MENFNYKNLSNLLVRTMMLQDKRNDYTASPIGRMLLSTANCEKECNNFQKFLSIEKARIIIAYYEDDSFYIITNRDERDHIVIVVNAYPLLNKSITQVKELYEILHDDFKAIFNFIYGKLYNTNTGCIHKDKIKDLTETSTDFIIRDLCIYNIYRMQSAVGDPEVITNYVAEAFDISDTEMELIIDTYSIKE